MAFDRPYIDAQEICATVAIKAKPCKGNPDGVTEINVTDFDPKKHELVNKDDAERIPQLQKKAAAKKGPFEG